jgi:regulator of ribonuclease activity A
MSWSCADLCDRHGENVLYCNSFPLRHFSKLRRFFGQIQTVRCHDDNSRVKEILATPGEGRVLVVDGAGSLARALMGDLIAESASKNDWRGVIINGVIRDSVAISQLESLGVCALGTNPRKSDRKGAGTIGESVNFMGLQFVPGDWIHVDEDGVIVSSHELHV